MEVAGTCQVVRKTERFMDQNYLRDGEERSRQGGR